MNLTLFILTSSLERWFVQKAPRKIREGSGLVRIFKSCLVIVPRMFGGRPRVFLAYLASPNLGSPNGGELVGPSGYIAGLWVLRITRSDQNDELQVI